MVKLRVCSGSSWHSDRACYRILTRRRRVTDSRVATELDLGDLRCDVCRWRWLLAKWTQPALNQVEAIVVELSEESTTLTDSPRNRNDSDCRSGSSEDSNRSSV